MDTHNNNIGSVRVGGLHVQATFGEFKRTKQYAIVVEIGSIAVSSCCKLHIVDCSIEMLGDKL